jgi:GNAT superfamily N-acetyltransferase
MAGDYASDKVAIGEWGARHAEEKARAEIVALLAEPGHRLERVVKVPDGAHGVASAIGWLWLGPYPSLERRGRGKSGWWIYDIEVDPPLRNRGWGTRILREVIDRASRAGQPRVALNVFSRNQGARRLYAREGWSVRREGAGWATMEREVVVALPLGPAARTSMVPPQ